jgi:cation diffusion facilitator family transporter
MRETESELDEASELEQRTLATLLSVNGFMFLVELVAGWLGDSLALLADGFDMLADATVYGIALYAVGRTSNAKLAVARASGLLQIALGLWVAVQAVWRLFAGSEPIGPLALAVGALALVANLVCLKLISRHREGEVHMRASWIFSVNDVIANIAVIVSGVLVWLTATRYPDLVVGLGISLLVMRGGVQILKETKARAAETPH